jgi:hypothetical protein
MYTRRFVLFLLSTTLLLAQPQTATLQVTGAVETPLTLSADDFAKMPRASVEMSSNGMETEYEVVWLHEVLKRAGVPQGEDKPAARSVPMLTKLEVVQVRK